MKGAFEGQLDLFAHSTDVMLRNDLIDAVMSRDAAAAQRALEALAAGCPDDLALVEAPCLVAELVVGVAPAFDDPVTAAAAVTWMDEQIAPAAFRLLGASASAAWLRLCWCDLARRAATLPFTPADSATHAAALWLRAGDWAAAAAAVESVESWRRIPLPLVWMAQARWYRLGSDAVWPLLAELAWIAPQRLPGLLRSLPDTRLHRLLRRFETDFAVDTDLHAEPAKWAWFPAWALVDDPQLAQPMASAEATDSSSAQQGYVLVRSLQHLERQGRHSDIVGARQRLRGLSPALFASYMRVR